MNGKCFLYHRYISVTKKKSGIYTRDDEEDPGNTWMPLIKVFPSFSRVVGSLSSCGGGLENFLSSPATIDETLRTFLYDNLIAPF